MVEPKYPGVVESYVNIGDCYDKKALGDVRAEILSCMGGYPACYQRAYRCLGAAEEIAAAVLAPEEDDPPAPPEDDGEDDHGAGDRAGEFPAEDLPGTGADAPGAAGTGV